LIIKQLWSKIMQTNLPEKMPFQKTISLTTLLLFNHSCKDTKLVTDLTSKLAQYAILQSQSLLGTEQIKQSRRAYKQLVVKTTFKDVQDFNNLVEKIKKDVDETAVGPIEELARDKLVQYDENLVQSASNLEQCQKILLNAKTYHNLNVEGKNKGEIKELKAKKKELKKVMQQFLKSNYDTVQQLQKAFNEPVEKVNNYLNALQIEK